MKRKNIYNYFLLVITIYACVNTPEVWAIDVSDVPVNPAVMGREYIDSFRENQYEQNDKTQKATQNKLKVDKYFEKPSYEREPLKTSQNPKTFYLIKLFFAEIQW